MEKEGKKGSGAILWIVLHVMLAVLSLGSVCSKMAAAEEALSLRWCIYYGLLLFILGVYAIVWQQIIKRLPLTVAYANRAVSVLWGCVFGVIFFKETITPGKIIGGIIVATGVILYATADAQGNEETINADADKDKADADKADNVDGLEEIGGCENDKEGV